MTMNLIPAIKEMEAAVRLTEMEYAGKIDDLKNGLIALRKLNTTCEKCEGKGSYLRPRVCAEDDRPDPRDPSDYIKCPECNGTGKVKQKE